MQCVFGVSVFSAVSGLELSLTTSRQHHQCKLVIYLPFFLCFNLIIVYLRIRILD